MFARQNISSKLSTIHFAQNDAETTATYLLKDHRLCCSYKLYDGNIFAQTRFDMCLRTKHVCVHCKHVLVDAIYVYSYSLGMVLQQKRLEANKVDDCKCFAHLWMDSMPHFGPSAAALLKWWLGVLVSCVFV